MKVLVTGSAGHLGEALVRTLQNTGHEVVGLDIVASKFTSQGWVDSRPLSCDAMHEGCGCSTPYGEPA